MPDCPPPDRTVRRRRRASVLGRALGLVACVALGFGPAILARPAAATSPAGPSSAEVRAAAEAPADEPAGGIPPGDEGSEAPADDGGAEPDDAALAESARQWYIDGYVERMGAAWSAGEVYADPQVASFWDERQQEITSRALEQVEPASTPVFIALIRDLPSRDRTGELDTGEADELIIEEILLADAEARGIGTALYVLWVPDSGVLTLRLSDGALSRSLTQVHARDLNIEVPGPAIHYAVRTGLDPSADAEPLDIEELTPTARDVRPEHAAADRVPMVPVFWTAVLIGVGGGLGVAYLVISWMIRAGAEALGAVPFLRSTVGRGRAAAADSVVLLRDLNRMRDRAIGARMSLERREPLPGDLGAAVDRLPAPGDTTNPLVWTAWTVLDDEARGRSRERCFFLPQLEADERRSWDGFGGDVEVPVSAGIARQLAAGEDPDFLSATGLGQGRPYWRDADSPFALSGFGAFRPLSAALADAPEDWEPEPGVFDEPSAFDAALREADERDRARRRQNAGDRRATPASAPLRPWLPAWVHVTVLALIIPALVAGLGSLRESDRRESIVSVASPAHLPLVALGSEYDMARVDAVAAAVEEDGVYIDPTDRIRYAPEDEERFARLVGESEEPVAVVVTSIERTDEFRGEQTAFELALFDRIPQDTTLILVGDGFVRYERYDAISDFTSGEQELRERTDDLPPPRVVEEYLLALPRIEWYEGMDLESEARRLYEADAEDYEPGPFPGTPEYLDRVRTSVIVLGATVFVVLGIGGLVLGRTYISNQGRK